MTETRWQKSSHSQNTTSCVELSNSMTLMRDSKNISGPTLRVDAMALVAAVKAGRFDR